MLMLESAIFFCSSVAVPLAICLSKILLMLATALSN